MLSQIGCVTLPPQTAEKLYHGQPLAFDEQAMASRLPVVAANLLGHIPRLEAVRDIVLQCDKHFDGSGTPAGPPAGEQIPWAARLLKIVFDYDALEAQGLAPEVALQTLRGRAGWYDPALLDALAAVLGAAGTTGQVREVRLRDVRPGMVFAADVTTRTGMLLIARGQEVTAGMLERIRNFSEHLGVKEPVLMTIPAAPGRPGHA
jgi:HD-GYP domain-containing protein (c-di-GMP phosphodiesterase class II)